ncbi:MAG TPA: hypothetical protein PKN36_04405 [bacterium]|nr:hypothetical protein [bacterium]
MEDDIKKRTAIFTNAVQEIFGERLLSVMGYGSIAAGSYIKGRSDINLVVVIDRLTVEEILMLRKKILKISLKNRLLPFFFSAEFIRSSSDIFPVEWKEIKEHHIILYGKDFAADITVKKEEMRLQLERELKQNYIDFQQGIIYNRFLFDVLEESYRSLKVFLRNIRDVCSEEIEEPEYFPRLDIILTGKRPYLSNEPLRKISQEHLSFLERLIKIIDKPGGRQ